MNKRYMNEWLDDEKEDLAKTAEALKEQYAKDAERVSLFAHFTGLFEAWSFDSLVHPNLGYMFR